MDNWPLYLLLVLAIGIGWWLGRRERLKSLKPVGSNYYQGLSHLLNEMPDRAVTPFVEDLEVTRDTLETHLALGSLLRRRGELEKAVVVHENILATAKLEIDAVLNVQLELARDYLLAGLLDRAESLLMVLIQKSGRVRTESLKLMLEIYEQEKEWQGAIEMGQFLAVGDGTEKYESAICHYYCEMAESLLQHGKLAQSREMIREAIGHDANNARVSLVLGRIELELGNYSDAIRVLRRIYDQDAVYVVESLDMLKLAYSANAAPGSIDGANREVFKQYLLQCLKRTSSISIVLVIAELIEIEQDAEAGAKFIANHLKLNPTVRGLTQLIDLHIDKARGVSRQNLLILQSFAEALIADKAAYRCQRCGFGGTKMRWHCPSCKRWGSIEPIFGLEGE